MSYNSRLPGSSKKAARNRLSEQDFRQGWSIWRILDPMFWVAFLFSAFLLKRKYGLNRTEIAFIMDNVSKHRFVLWVNAIGGMLFYYGLKDSNIGQLGSLISILIAPAFISGSAWFAITFGGVSQKLLDIALLVTLWMFSAFSLSLTAMSIAAYFISNGNWLVLSVLIFINIGVIYSAILYDHVDGLKVGLDEALKNHSLAQLRYLKKHFNIEPPYEGQNLYDGLSDSDKLKPNKEE